MAIPPALDDGNLTGQTKALAERIEPRLNAGVETFANLHRMALESARTFVQVRRIAMAATAIALVVAAFVTWSVGLAKRSDVSETDAITKARIVDLDKRAAALELQRASDAAAIAKAFGDVSSQLREQANVLLDIRIRLGPPTAAPAVLLPAPKKEK